MASNTPALDLAMLPTYNVKLLAIADASYYPTGWNVSVPSISITPPGYVPTMMTFVAGGLQLYNANSLGLCTVSDVCDMPPLPDGIYKVRYTITPANVYFIDKTFLRTDKIESDLDYAFLKLEMMECDGQLKRQKKETIDLIEFYIQGAIAAADQCALKMATDLLGKARRLLDSFVNSLDSPCCR